MVKIQKLKPGYPLDVGSLDKSKKPRYNKYEVESGKDKGTAPMPDLTSIRKQEAMKDIQLHIQIKYLYMILKAQVKLIQVDNEETN